MSKYKVGDKILIEAEITDIAGLYYSFRVGGSPCFWEKWYLEDSSSLMPTKLSHEDLGDVNDYLDFALETATSDEIYKVDGDYLYNPEEVQEVTVTGNAASTEPEESPLDIIKRLVG